MAFLTRDTILAAVERRTKTEPSSVFGGDLCLRELSRLDYRAASMAAEIPGKPGHIYTDVWHAAIFAAVVVDPKTEEPLFTADDVLAWGNRDETWKEVVRIASLGLELSEVGADALTKSGAAADD
jgi:hypothetical protein